MTPRLLVLCVAAILLTGVALGQGQRTKPPATGEPRVFLGLDRKRVQVGEQFTVTVRIERGRDVAHVPFHLEFDPAALRFVSGSEGTLLNSDGADTIFQAATAERGGRVIVGLSRLGRAPGVAGDGQLCALEFEALAPGESVLAFSHAGVRNGKNREVTARFESLPIRVR